MSKISKPCQCNAEILEIDWEDTNEAVILLKIEGEIFQGYIIKQEGE